MSGSMLVETPCSEIHDNEPSTQSGEAVKQIIEDELPAPHSNLVNTSLQAVTRYLLPHAPFLDHLSQLVINNITEVRSLEDTIDENVEKIRTMSVMVRNQLHPPDSVMGRNEPSYMSLVQDVCSKRAAIENSCKRKTELVAECKLKVLETIQQLEQLVAELPDAPQKQRRDRKPISKRSKIRSSSKECVEGSSEITQSTQNDTETVAPLVPPLTSVVEVTPQPEVDQIQQYADPTVKCLCGWVTVDAAIGCDNPNVRGMLYIVPIYYIYICSMYGYIFFYIHKNTSTVGM
eukprot:GHVL01044402.1.p1 GENE.GHVL01044402.1~~GHVL01044402.1.p1  ORF type:complete len:290 (+),score=50.30 GHVL01044402.1:121-990(+)